MLATDHDIGEIIHDSVCVTHAWPWIFPYISNKSLVYCCMNSPACIYNNHCKMGLKIRLPHWLFESIYCKIALDPAHQIIFLFELFFNITFIWLYTNCTYVWGLKTDVHNFGTHYAHKLILNMAQKEYILTLYFCSLFSMLLFFQSISGHSERGIWHQHRLAVPRDQRRQIWHHRRCGCRSGAAR